MATLAASNRVVDKLLDRKKELQDGFVDKVKVAKRNKSFHNPKFTPLQSSGQPLTLPRLREATQAQLESFSNPILVGEPDRYFRTKQGKSIQASKSP